MLSGFNPEKSKSLTLTQDFVFRDLENEFFCNLFERLGILTCTQRPM